MKMWCLKLIKLYFSAYNMYIDILTFKYFIGNMNYCIVDIREANPIKIGSINSRRVKNDHPKVIPIIPPTWPIRDCPSTAIED